MKCYAAYAKDETTRNQGSSGGFYPVISTKFIENGGIVYACVYDKDLNVLFKRVDNLEDLPSTFTSKYVQSDSTGVYKSVCDDLQNKNRVLFCGTTCQVNALHNFLQTRKMNTDNLLTIDFICHGVPSKKVFHMFLDQYSESKLLSLNMRNKDLGWNCGNYSWKMEFANGEEKTVKQSEIPYMKGFLSDIFLRPSCYNCVCKTKKKSDITIGDFWGITDTDLKTDYKKGVSCVIINSNKGDNEFNRIQNDLFFLETDYNSILAGNPSLKRSSKRPIFRKKFFNEFEKCDSLENLVDKLNKKSYFAKVKNKLYKEYIKEKTSVNNFIANNERVIYNCKENCSGCMACHSICPKGAIEIKTDNEGFSYPVINKDICIDCGLCEKVCPYK